MSAAGGTLTSRSASFGVRSETMAQMIPATMTTGDTNRMNNQSCAWLGSTGSPQNIAANAPANTASVSANLRRLRGLYPGLREHETHCHRFQKPTGINGIIFRLNTLNVRT